MQADEVALLEQLVELVDAADAQGLVDPLAEVGVVEDDVEPQGLGAEGRRRADPAAADDPEGLAAQAGRAQGGPVVPGPRPDRLVRRQQPPRQGQQEHDRVVGDLLRAVVGHVADDHAVAGRGIQVDVVVPHPRADDAAASRRPGEAGLAQDRQVVEHDDRIGTAASTRSTPTRRWPGP